MAIQEKLSILEELVPEEIIDNTLQLEAQRIIHIDASLQDMKGNGWTHGSIYQIKILSQGLEISYLENQHTLRTEYKTLAPPDGKYLNLLCYSMTFFLLSKIISLGINFKAI